MTSKPGHSVQIAGTEIHRVEYENQAVVTFSMIDQVHDRPSGTAGRAFREHRERFTQDIDFVNLNQADEIRRLGFTRPQGGVPASVYLITRRGYLKLTKTLNDNRAWEVFDDMIECYFEVKQAPKQQSFNMPDNFPKDPILAAICGTAMVLDQTKQRVEALEERVVNLETQKSAEVIDFPQNPKLPQFEEPETIRFCGGPKLYKHVTAWRKERGIDHKDLAKLIGHPASTLSEALRGRTKGPKSKQCLRDLKAYVESVG